MRRNTVSAATLVAALLAAAAFVAPMPAAAGVPAPLPTRATDSAGPLPPPGDARMRVVTNYLDALQAARYAAAFQLLNPAARTYYRDADNLRSVFDADGYRLQRYRLTTMRTSPARGSVFFARETARFRDHARDADLQVTATVPVGVVPEGAGWAIKDPGHPWRAFAAASSADVAGVRVTVKKLSFFARRIEAVVTFTNHGTQFVTVLPYGRSLLRDGAGVPYRLIETRDWSLTDKVLFEGLRLAPSARYTGTLAFTSDALDNTARTFTLTVAPLLADGTDAPFSVDVPDIAPAAREAIR